VKQDNTDSVLQVKLFSVMFAGVKGWYCESRQPHASGVLLPCHAYEFHCMSLLHDYHGINLL
jgi:hypothetical protein